MLSIIWKKIFQNLTLTLHFERSLLWWHIKYRQQISFNMQDTIYLCQLQDEALPFSQLK